MDHSRSGMISCPNDIACKHTKFDDYIVSAVPEIFQGCEILDCVT